MGRLNIIANVTYVIFGHVLDIEDLRAWRSEMYVAKFRDR